MPRNQFRTLKNRLSLYKSLRADSGDKSIEDTIRERYDPNGKGRYDLDAIKSDMGLGDYASNTQLVTTGENPEGRYVGGRFYPDTNEIFIRSEKGIPAETQVSHFMHEAGHLGDNTNLYPYKKSDPRTGAPTHHELMEDFEVEMPILMQAQKDIEEQYDVDPAIMARYPSLKKVVPRSSNMLATPWSIKENRLLQPKEWNANQPTEVVEFPFSDTDIGSTRSEDYNFKKKLGLKKYEPR